jgi:hypothetical protein
MTVIEDRFALLDSLTLLAGSHGSFAEGVCAMEAAAWLAGEPHSDSPACVDPVIAAFSRSWNDSLPDNATRNRLLKPLISKMIGTAFTLDVQAARAFMVADWAVRVFTPAWLRLADLEANAIELEGLKALTSMALCKEAKPAIDRAGAAAWAAAGDARAAAGAAAGAAAWAAAGAAAWAAAGAAAGAAAWAAAGAAARAAAGDARDAWGAAGDAARAAGDARAAARARLAPTVEQLQQSAVELIERMCALTPEAVK